MVDHQRLRRHAVLFVVDSRTGRTVGARPTPARSTDVEALAPGRRRRRSGSATSATTRQSRARRCSVYRVADRRAATATSTPPSLRAGLPRRAARRRDAARRTARRRLYVVTKAPLGGTVYVAPSAAGTRTGPTGWRRSPGVPGWSPTRRSSPTAGTCCCAATAGRPVYTFPGFRRVGSSRCPSQPQGEGISVGPGRPGPAQLRGRDAAVLQVGAAGRRCRRGASAEPHVPTAGAPTQPGDAVPPTASASPRPGGRTVPAVVLGAQWLWPGLRRRRR